MPQPDCGSIDLARDSARLMIERGDIRFVLATRTRQNTPEHTRTGHVQNARTRKTEKPWGALAAAGPRLPGALGAVWMPPGRFQNSAITTGDPLDQKQTLDVPVYEKKCHTSSFEVRPRSGRGVCITSTWGVASGCMVWGRICPWGCCSSF